MKITPEGRLEARAAGQAKVTVTHGGQSREVAVTVNDLRWNRLAIEPAYVSVPLDDAATVRVMGTLEDGRRAEVAPGRLSTARRPRRGLPSSTLACCGLRGLDPTTAKEPQTLALDYGRLRASAPVEVLLAPMQLELSPAGPIPLPLGQRITLEAAGLYRGGQRRAVAVDRLEWHAEAAGNQAGKDGDAAVAPRRPLTLNPSRAPTDRLVRGEGSK